MVDYKERSGLVSKIKHEAGFILTHHAIGRPDFNDWRSDEDYIRAVHNIILGNPADIRSIIDEAADRAQCDRFGACVGRPEQGVSADDFDAVVYGLLPKRTERVYTVSAPKTVAVAKKGLAGLFGQTEAKEVAVEKEERKIVYDGAQQVSSLIHTEDCSDAYFMRCMLHARDFLLHHRYPEGSPRMVMGFPMLTVICSDSIMNDTLSYIQRNPGEYQSIVQLLFNSSREFPIGFPNVKKNLLAHACAADTLYLLNVDSCEEVKDEVQGVPWHFRLSKGFYEKHAMRLTRKTG